MVSRNLRTGASPLGILWWAVGAMVLACSASGCSEPVVPDTWAGLPVVISSADAASFTLQVADEVALNGKESAEVGDKVDFKKHLVPLVREKLEAAGFKMAPAGATPDVVATLQVSDAEWTGKWWHARGNIVVTLTKAADQTPLGQASVHFGDVDFAAIPEATASRVAEAVVRSPELAGFVKTKREKEQVAVAPPPPPTPPPPPPPPPPGLERDQVKGVMTKLRLKFSHCYHNALVNNPGLTGTIVLKLAIAPAGSVEAVEADSTSTLADTGVAGCVGEVTKGASFPTAPGPTKMTWPLEFAPWPAPDLGKGGGLEAADVQKAVRGASEKLHACFDAAMKKDAAFAGLLKVKFSIDKKGAVTGKPTFEKDSTIKDKDAEKCVGEAIKAITFPKSKKNTVVTYPIEVKGPG